MEGVATANDTTGHTKLYHLVLGKPDNASGGEEILRVLRTAQDLEEDGNSRRHKRDAIDSEATILERRRVSSAA